MEPVEDDLGQSRELRLCEKFITCLELIKEDCESFFNPETKFDKILQPREDPRLVLDEIFVGLKNVETEKDILGELENIKETLLKKLGEYTSNAKKILSAIELEANQLEALKVQLSNLISLVEKIYPLFDPSSRVTKDQVNPGRVKSFSLASYQSSLRAKSIGRIESYVTKKKQLPLLLFSPPSLLLSLSSPFLSLSLSSPSLPFFFFLPFFSFSFHLKLFLVYSFNPSITGICQESQWIN